MDKDVVPRLEVCQILGRHTLTGPDLSVARMAGTWRFRFRPGVHSGTETSLINFRPGSISFRQQMPGWTGVPLVADVRVDHASGDVAQMAGSRRL